MKESTKGKIIIWTVVILLITIAMSPIIIDGILIYTSEKKDEIILPENHGSISLERKDIWNGKMKIKINITNENNENLKIVISKDYYFEISFNNSLDEEIIFKHTSGQYTDIRITFQSNNQTIGRELKVRNT